MREDFKEAFKEEAVELLAELENALLALEAVPEDEETIGRVFRSLHTIKGSGAMFGFEDIVAFTHEVETVFDLVRDGKVAVSKPLIDLTLSSRDLIRGMLEGGGDAAADQARARGIIEALKAFVPTGGGPRPGCGSAAVQPAPPEEELIYRIHFRPHVGLFGKGTNPILLLNELRELGACKVTAHMDAIPDLEAIDPEGCYTYWDVLLKTRQDVNALRDVFLFVEDDCELKIERLAGEVEEDPADKRLGEILTERGYLRREELDRALNEQKRIGEVLIDSGVVDATHVQSALLEQQQLRELRERHQREEQASSVRVPADRLDVLVDLVGELVTVQARLSQHVSRHEDAELVSIAEEVERLTAELRDNTMSIRMLPIGTTFNKFRRLVRDLAGELGKEVTLVTDGAETELDKTVIERLNDPLVHLIRNSIDHGLERPEDREAAGKPRQGVVSLSARHSGANVLIEISDDGAGLDRDAIRTHAVERAIIAPDAELQEKEVFDLIFAPGFSMAKELTNISGRGVGMDVVKRGIESLRGSIEVSSRKGTGTTITLKLPLTLAIIDGLLVKIGTGHFVLPLSVVEECVELMREAERQAGDAHVTYIRGEIVPYIRLRDRFHVSGELPEIEQIVITETGGTKVGFVVDKVLGEHQTVIKNLGRIYGDVRGVSGATILGDGTVALILDVAHLLQEVELEDALVH